MPAVDPVILELRADVARYRNELRATATLVDRSLGQQERAVQRLEFQMEASGNRIGSIFGRLGGLAAGFSLLKVTQEFLQLADVSKQIQAQLGLATKSFGSFAQAEEDTQRIAAATRSSLEATGSLYGNFTRAAQSLGASQEQAARATETFSKALKIGGADANATASATLQFGQALASGALRGDEFNSIAEASPRILQLLADALGKPRGELRQLAEEGKLTSDVLFRAFTDRRFTNGIDEEFETLPITINDAMTKVRNAAIVTFGAFDRGGEFSTALANFVTDGSDGFKSLGTDAQNLGIEIRSTMAGLADVFSPMLEGARSVFAQIGGDGRSVVEQIRGDISTILGLYDRVRNLDTGAERGVRRAGNALVRGGVLERGIFYTPESQMPQYSNARGNFESGTGSDERLRRARARLDAAARRLDKAGFVVPRNVDGTVNEAGIKRRVNPPAEPKTVKAEKPKKKTGPSAETLANRAEALRQKELRNDEAFANEKAALEADLLRAKQAIASSAETVAQFEVQEIEAARTRQNAGYQADVAQKKLTQARADELVALNDKVAAERIAAVNLREQERRRADAVAIAESDLANARDIAEAEGRLAETAEQRKAAALRLLNLEYQMERARLDAIVASERSTEAEKEIARRRLAVLGQLEASDRKGVERENEGPLARYRRDLNLDVNEQLQQIEVNALRELEDSIVDSAKAALGLKGALGDIVGELIRIGIQRKIIGPLADALFGKAGGSASGGLGNIITSIGSFFGRASGGYVAPGQMVRVNEAGSPGRVEGLRLNGMGGTVIPLGHMNAMASRGNTIVQQTFVLDARGGVTTSELLERMNGLAQEAAVQGAQAGRALAGKDFASQYRPRI